MNDAKRGLIIIEAPGAATPETVERLREMVKKEFGPDVKVLVLADGLKLSPMSVLPDHGA